MIPLCYDPHKSTILTPYETLMITGSYAINVDLTGTEREICQNIVVGSDGASHGRLTKAPRFHEN